MNTIPPKTRPSRIVIDNVEPTVPGGNAPKLALGDHIDVSATIIRDGHEALRAVVRHRAAGGTWHEAPMREAPGLDRWSALISPQELGDHEFQIEAWTDRFASWRHEMRRRIDGGQTDLGSEILEGVALLRAAKLKGDQRARVAAAAALLDSDADQDEKLAAAMSDDLHAAMSTSTARDERVRSTAVPLVVDRERATFGAWYELFPRSWGGFAGIQRELPRFAQLGVDVLYLPPIHPIGVRHRKGRNNTLDARPGDPGSPWAIGGAEGGHTAIHPELGTMDEFRTLVDEARERDIDIALDFAIQCSPDHPWLTEHPDWFSRRPDGTLKYAENPPKKYQDIYNVDFDCEDWRGLWQALAEVVEFWVDAGVRIFRVDNPHTKPIGFWRWLIARVRAEHPDVIFLAEAFTKPATMLELGRIGFNQSYTYFTWRNGAQELAEYVTELADPAVAAVFRPNFFANTPDILHAYLQHGGPPAFHARLVLAATLGPSYGIYSGFEHFENTPVREGSEEYLDSEKYEAKRRSLDGPLLERYARLNVVRRTHPALRRIGPIRFLHTGNDQLIAYVKGIGPDAIITVVNIDPHNRQVGGVDVPGDISLPDHFQVTDELTSWIFDWHVGGNYVALDPGDAHVMSVRR